MFNLDTKGQLIIDPNILTIPEFAKIWNNDKSETKEKAKQQLSYIYMLLDFKSPYVKSYSGEALEKEVALAIMKDVKFKPTATLKAAVNKYKDLMVVKTLKTFSAADSAMDQIRKYLEDFNLDTVAEADKAKAVEQTMKIIKDLPAVSLSLEKARREVEKEIQSMGRMVGGSKIKTRELPRNRRK